MELKPILKLSSSSRDECEEAERLKQAVAARLGQNVAPFRLHQLVACEVTVFGEVFTLALSNALGELYLMYTPNPLRPSQIEPFRVAIHDSAGLSAAIRLLERRHGRRLV